MRLRHSFLEFWYWVSVLAVSQFVYGFFCGLFGVEVR